MSCIICEIVNGNEKSFTVFEDKNFIVFLDVRPLFLGHCLLSTKAHVASLDDLAKDQLQHYFFFDSKNE